MERHKIIILDFSTGEVHIFDFDHQKHGTGEEFLIENFSEQGQTFKEGQCQWMIVNLEKFEGRLPIYIH